MSMLSPKTPAWVLRTLGVVLLLPLLLFAKSFVKPVAQPASTYPAHDNHSDDKLAIAADPYDTPEKAKIFSLNFA